MEIKVRDKGRITLPLSIRKALGIKEEDTIVLDVEGNKVVLKPKKLVSVKEVKGIAKIGKVVLEDIEEALGK
jgi:AbrB family looped-hinge helix DNA binding protein